MKKRFIAAGVLAGGIALTGVAGSAYAASGGGTEHPARAALAVPGKAGAQGPITVRCTGGHAKVKGEKGLTSVRKPPGRDEKGGTKMRTGTGTALPAPPPGAEVVTKKGALPVIKAPKGVHCTQVKGVPGAPPKR
jgi:hypothetical protein